MAPKFSVGQNVKVTDQRPAASGVVKEVSTWKRVLGIGKDSPVYSVYCKEWAEGPRWIGEPHLEAA